MGWHTQLRLYQYLHRVLLLLYVVVIIPHKTVFRILRTFFLSLSLIRGFGLLGFAGPNSHSSRGSNYAHICINSYSVALPSQGDARRIARPLVSAWNALRVRRSWLDRSRKPQERRRTQDDQSSKPWSQLGRLATVPRPCQQLVHQLGY